jgi:hypothetical protein
MMESAGSLPWVHVTWMVRSREGGQEGGASKRCISRYSGPGLQSWFNIVPLILKFVKPQLAPHGLHSVYFVMNLPLN